MFSPLPTAQLHNLIRLAEIAGLSLNSEQRDLLADINLFNIEGRYPDYNREDVNLLWRVAARIDSRIEPIPAGERQFEEDKTRPIIEIARQKGQRIFPIE